MASHCGSVASALLTLRCCGAEGPEDWARSVFNGFRDLDHAPEIGIPRTPADVVGGMALTGALPKVLSIVNHHHMFHHIT